MGALLFWAFLAAALPCLLAIGYLLERQARRALDAEMTLRVQALATTVRAAISPVAWESLLRLEPGEDESRTAQTVRERLESVRREIAADWLGVWTPDGTVLIETSGRYRLGEIPARAALLGRELEEVRAGRVAASPLFQSESGRFIKIGLAGIEGAFSPPSGTPPSGTPPSGTPPSGTPPSGTQTSGVLSSGRSPSGEPAAVVLVSAESGSLEAIQSMRRTMLGLALLGTLLVLIVAALLARRLNRRLAVLAQAAGAIGRGRLDQTVPDLGRDEIGLLARTLEQMRASVRARERQLRAMLGGVAHEIRNPLGGLILSSEMLSRDRSLGEKQQRQAGRILAEGERLERVVEAFLEYASPRDPVPSAVALEPLAADCLETAQMGLGWEGTASARGPAACAWCDPDHLRQMILNLLRNAMQAAGSGGRVEVTWERVAGRGDGHRAGRETERRANAGAPRRGDACLLLRVADDGPGIPTEKREVVFEPFETGKAKGAGLGLAIVAQLAERNSAAVRIEDGRAGGAAVVLELPAAEGHADGVPEGDPKGAPEGIEGG